MKSLYYIWSQSRAHKLLPLLDDFNVIEVKSVYDLFKHINNRSQGKCVIVDSFGIIGVKGVMLSFLLRIPLVIRLRGDFISELDEVCRMNPTAKGKLLRMLHRAIGEVCLWWSSLVIVNSEYLKSVIHGHYPTKPIEVVYNPYTVSLKRNFPLPRGLADQGLRLLSATNFNLRSKVDPLFVAMSQWMHPDCWTQYDIHWVVCGAGVMAEEFCEKVKTLPFRDRIHYLGYVDSLDSLLDWSSLFVHMTQIDAFPNVTLEAMMHRRPVLTNTGSCGTLEQVFHQKNGLIVANAGEFSDGIAYIAENAHIAHEFGEEGMRVVKERYSVSKQREAMRYVLFKMQGHTK